VPGYQLGSINMSGQRGLFCRYACEVEGRRWYVLPKSSDRFEDLVEAIALRNAHELIEHGAVFLVPE
jgi:hypothetical protein